MSGDRVGGGGVLGRAGREHCLSTGSLLREEKQLLQGQSIGLEPKSFLLLTTMACRYCHLLFMYSFIGPLFKIS